MFGTVAAVLLLCGCGSPDDIEGALARSPLTYWHYRDAAWWGRDPHIRLALVRRDGAWSVAKLVAPNGVQWVLLRKRGTWRIVDAVAGKAVRLYCKLAPPAVIPALVGGCQIYAQESWESRIAGPPDRRPPTPTERAAISRRFLGTAAPCGALEITVSRLDPTYATLGEAPSDRHTGCKDIGSGGLYLFRHGTRGWREAGLEVDGFSCIDAPPGVIRSLTDHCWID